MMLQQVKEQQSLWENYQKLEQKHGTDTLLQPTDKNSLQELWENKFLSLSHLICDTWL